MGCLTSLVGITPNDCACVDKGGEAAPLTGLYIDDMEVGIQLQPINSAADCGAGSLVDMIDRSRNEGESTFMTDYTVMMRTFNRPRLRKVSDVIGKMKSNVALTLTEDLVGLNLRSLNVRGGSFKITKFKLNINAPASPSSTRTITIIDKDGDEVDSFQVLPNTFIEPDITLDTSKSYTLVFDRSQFNDTVFNNRLTCSCAGASKGWSKYYDINGVKGNDTDDLISPNTTVTLAYGFTMYTTADCEDLSSWLCADPDLFISDGYFRTVAKIYQLYVIRRLINYILNSNNVNRYTLLDNERLMGRGNKVQKMINEYMDYLVKNVPETNNCWICGNKRIFSKKAIIATQPTDHPFNIYRHHN